MSWLFEINQRVILASSENLSYRIWPLSGEQGGALARGRRRPGRPRSRTRRSGSSLVQGRGICKKEGDSHNLCKSQ